jgi:cell division transport system ATP-binding protein
LIGVSFAIEPGEMVFVTGHSGAGKSTMLRLLSRMEAPSEGDIEVLGESLSRMRRPAIHAYRRRLGLVFQDHRLLADRSVFENVALPLILAGTAEAEMRRRVGAVLEQLGLRGLDGVRPGSLSTGQQQRVGIARAIVARPPILLADEPTGNLDPHLSQEVMQLFLMLGAEGTTVLIASHDLPLIQRMRRRVLVLDRGRLIDDFRPTKAAA